MFMASPSLASASAVSRDAPMSPPGQRSSPCWLVRMMGVSGAVRAALGRLGSKLGRDTRIERAPRVEYRRRTRLDNDCPGQKLRGARRTSSILTGVRSAAAAAATSSVPGEFDPGWVKSGVRRLWGRGGLECDEQAARTGGIDHEGSPRRCAAGTGSAERLQRTRDVGVWPQQPASTRPDGLRHGNGHEDQEGFLDVLNRLFAQQYRWRSM